MKSRNSNHEQRLERLTHEALRQLPPCRAPASLEARVLHEIEARATRPRPAAGISHWPVAARVALVTVCALCVPLAWVLVMSVRMQLTYTLAATGATHVLHSMRGTSDALLLLVELAARLAHQIPDIWMLGGLLVTGALYAALSALGYFVLGRTVPHSKVHST